MAATPWEYDKIQLWVVLNLSQFSQPNITIPVVRAQVDFELNAIPRALCYLPVGRDLSTLKSSPVNQALNYLTTQVPVSLVAWITPRFASSKTPKNFGIPGATFTLFDGYVAGIGQAKSRSGVQFYLSLQHWLGQLSFSSTVSASSVPVNPRKYTFGAMLPSGNPGNRNYVGPYDPAGALKPNNISADLWGQTLQAFFTGLAQVDGLQVLEQGVPSSGNANDGALNALKRMSSTKLPLQLRLSPDTTLFETIRQDISQLSRDPEALAHHTFWDVIVGMCAPEYLFAVVPQITAALVVPFIPACQMVYTTITADSYVAVDRTRTINRPLRAVGILSAMDSSTGSDFQPDGAPEDDKMGVGGWYSPNNAAPGMILITQGPRWAYQLVATTNYSANAAGGRGNPINTVDAPNAVAPNPALKDNAKARGASVIKPVLNRFAEARYVQENTQLQQGTISGPLRFDIAPGSSIGVEGSSDSTIADDATGKDFFGTVLRTSIMVDAESRQAGTAFHLAYLRSSYENGTPGKSLATHPLYTSTFYGAGLIGDPIGKTGS